MNALHNIRVLDLTHVIAGPFCTYQLAVMGAEVIKVEAPATADMMRATTPQFPHGEAGLAPGFVSQSANKRAIAVNLKCAPGRAILHDLVKTADVLVENYRSGALARLGLGYADVKPLKPDIIYCSLSGFGQTGPKAQHTAYDNVIQAFSGLMAANGAAGDAAVKIGPPLLDYASGIQAAYAIVAALYHRQHTGNGQYIDIAMLDAALMLMSSHITYWQQHGRLPQRSNHHNADHAGYACYDTSDGQLMLGAYSGDQYADLWAALGDAAYGEQFRGVQVPVMAASATEDRQRIAARLKQNSAAHWESVCQAHNVPAARVRSLDETLAHEQLQHRNVLQTAGTPRKYPTAAFDYATDGPALHSPPPLFAQHTREVLAELNYSTAEIDAWIEQGVVAD